MSVVPRGRNILRKHYQEAKNENEAEYKSAAFWHAWLTRAFNDLDRYEVSSEFAPDDTRRRVDLVVKRYDGDNDTLYALLWVECKRPKMAPREVEFQGLDAAVRHIEADGLMFIYVMTTIGVSFRTWIVKKDTKTLVPLHGNPEYGDKDEYVDADSAGAHVLMQTVQRVKAQEPLREAPIVPSQPANPPLGQYKTYQTAESSTQANARQQQQQVYAAQQQQQVYAAQQQQQVYAAQQQSSGQAEASNAGSPAWQAVKVTKRPHTLRADEYLFKDVRGVVRSTKEEDWVETDVQGRTASIYRGKRTSYYTYDWPT
ncbi:MAG: hypothetical protein Q9165_007974 [Trypethelium subeluteriae]